MKIKSLYIIFFLAAFALLTTLANAQESYWDEDEVFQYGFTLPLDQSLGLENREITSLEELNEQINEFFIPADLYFSSYNDLKINTAIKRPDNIFYVEYKIGESVLKSYSIFKPTLNNHEIKTATVIIPGSNENQSIQIFNGVGYHKNIANEVSQLGDVYIATKPNQDFLGIHRGGKKLNYTFLINYMLNKGGSYSVSYIVNTLATVKYLKTIYERVFVIGLSQGGAAALLNSLQSSPDAAVVASGFTVTREIFEGSGFDQIIIPNSSTIISNQYIHEKIKSQSTNYFFSWGSNEKGIYKLEVENKYTQNYFNNLKNVECNFHHQGHSFPQPYTNNFLSKIPFAAINVDLTSRECEQDIYLKTASLSGHNITEYQWFRNDSLVNSTDDSILLNDGGNYKLIVVTSEDKIFGSREINVDQIHFERNLIIEKNLIVAPKGFKKYRWYLDGELLEDEDESFIVIKKEGKYRSCLTSNWGTFRSEEMVVDISYPYIATNFEALFAHPNPNTGKFKIVLTSSKVSSEAVNIIIFNNLGQNVFKTQVIPDSKIAEFDIELGNLKSGRYIIKAVSTRHNLVKSILIN